MANNNSLGVATPPIPALIQDTLPATALNMIGDQVTFTAVFSDAPAAIFQWQRISNGATNDLSGATTTTLTLTNLQLADTASYWLKAVNATNPQAINYTSARPLVVDRLPAAVNNIITSVAGQTGPGGTTIFAPTWTVTTNNNLIAGRLPSNTSGNFSLEAPGREVTSLTTGDSLGLEQIAGTTAARTTSTNYVTCGHDERAGASITYLLGGRENGYDLSNLTVYGGWVDAGRDQQAYTIYYSTAMSPELFIPLGGVNFNPPNPADAPSATQIATYMAQTGILLRMEEELVLFPRRAHSGLPAESHRRPGLRETGWRDRLYR